MAETKSELVEELSSQATKAELVELLGSRLKKDEISKLLDDDGDGTKDELLRKLGSRGWLEASNAGRRYPADADPAMLFHIGRLAGRSKFPPCSSFFRNPRPPPPGFSFRGKRLCGRHASPV